MRDPLGRLDPQALLRTDPAREPVRILRWLVRRRRIETTFQEARAHLGVETQPHRSDLAIARTTPCLLGLLSLAALLGARLSPEERRAGMTAAWRRQQQPTFGDTLAAVRKRVRREQGLVVSWNAGEVAKLRPTLREGWECALCHAT